MLNFVTLLYFHFFLLFSTLCLCSPLHCLLLPPYIVTTITVKTTDFICHYKAVPTTVPDLLLEDQTSEQTFCIDRR
jgi:hypothetical protein